MDKIVECVPNFSEGRDLQKVEQIVDAFRAREGVKLLDYSNDRDHNRMVVTAVGTPEAMKEAVLEAIGRAARLIDLTRHTGGHPRMGAADVVPFIPVRGMDMDEAVALSREVGQAVAERYGIPVYLYEKSATAPHRENLADVRRGQFEGLAEKMARPEWQPDFGPARPHPTAGACIVGARIPLIAYNINLNTDRLDVAQAIARRIRHSGGGLRYCKAMGVALHEKGIVQVSMNRGRTHRPHAPRRTARHGLLLPGAGRPHPRPHSGNELLTNTAGRNGTQRAHSLSQCLPSGRHCVLTKRLYMKM